MIGNETWNTGNYAGYTTAANHKADVIAFSQRMKAVDPTIKIVACGNGTNSSWNSTVLSGSNAFDYLTINGYFNPGTSYTNYQNSNSTYQNVTTIVSQIATYSQAGDGSRIRPCYYEWNGFDWNNGWANKNDLGHALLNFQIQGDMLNKPGCDFSCLWNTRWVGNDPTSNYNALKADGSFTAVGQSLAIWGNHLLDKMVSCSSSNQLVRAFASTSTGGSMNAFFINKDTVSHTVTVSLGSYNPQSTVECWQMTGGGDTDQSPVWAQKTSLTASGTTATVTLPAVSITMLKLASAIPAPSVTGISPSSGDGAGGTTVTITGSNLQFTTAVTFDGVPATSVSVTGPNSVTCVAPARGPGPVDVALTTTSGSGTKANAYSYVVGITASAGPNGSISPSGYVPISNSGTDQSFTITPNSGYMIGDVKVDGVSVGMLPSYTFTNVTANHTIAATFTVPAPDTTPPVITTPGTIGVDATSADGAVVNFVTSAFDAVSGAVPTHDSIASGSLFPVGRTTVTVTAQDAAGNVASASFEVNVLPVPLVKANNLITLNSGSSWVGGTAPGPADNGLWNGTYTNGTVGIGTGLTVSTLRLLTPSTGITISAGTGNLTLGLPTASVTSANELAVHTGGQATIVGNLMVGKTTTTFTILNSTGGLSGGFSNVAFGSRITTGGGEGTFLVTQSGNTVRLSDYSANPGLSPIETWRQMYFGSFINADDAADNADPDNDGIANLIEYALGTVPNSAASRSVPVLATAGDRLTLRFHRAGGDLTYIVEAGSDLTSWPPVAINPGTVGQDVTVTDTVDISTANPSRRFLRLRITNP
jgi:hypothetical protein